MLTKLERRIVRNWLQIERDQMRKIERLQKGLSSVSHPLQKPTNHRMLEAKGGGGGRWSRCRKVETILHSASGRPVPKVRILKRWSP